MFTTTAGKLAAQKQTDLFAEQPQEFTLRPGATVDHRHWVGHASHAFDRRNRAWTHAALPGITVRHCGHPTALRPYYVDGDRWTWPRLVDAQRRAVEVFTERLGGTES